MTTIKIGSDYRFDYPTEFNSLPEHSAHRGQSVTVVRELSENEYDFEGELMFLVRASDGWEGHAWESELVSLESGT